MALRPHAEETLLKHQDEKYRRVATQAIQRIHYILDTKDHFTHQEREKGKVLRNQTQEQKRSLYASLEQLKGEGSHRWQTKGRALQRSQCLKRVTLHTKLEVLKQVQQEKCQGAPAPLVGGTPPPENKQEVVQQILQGSLEKYGPAQIPDPKCLHCLSAMRRANSTSCST